MENLMTQNEYTDYLKLKAKTLGMDYVEMMERIAWLNYQAWIIKENKQLTSENNIDN